MTAEDGCTCPAAYGRPWHSKRCSLYAEPALAPPSSKDESLTVDQAVGMLVRCSGYVLPKEKADRLIAYIKQLDYDLDMAHGPSGRPAVETAAEPMKPELLVLVMDWILNEEGWRPTHPDGFFNSKFEKIARAAQAEWDAIQSSPKTSLPHTHVWEKDGICDGAICSCGKRADQWYCPDSPDHLCHYDKGNLDSCDYCGDPEERK